MKDRKPATKTVLEVRDVNSFYDDLQILRQVSLRLDEGEIVALFGPNGHGKSTLLKAISGIHPPSSGSILYRGQEIAGAPTEKIVEAGLAYIPEARNLFPEMTVLENLTLGAYNRIARRKLDSSLRFVFSLFPQLTERKNQVVSTLSGGESRMVAVGRGLMSSASLLLVDEPSIGLSPMMKKVVFKAIHQIRKETAITILIVEQEIDYPLRLADRVYLLKKGQIVLEKRACEIDKAEIKNAYF